MRHICTAQIHSFLSGRGPADQPDQQLATRRPRLAVAFPCGSFDPSVNPARDATRQTPVAALNRVRGKRRPVRRQRGLRGSAPKQNTHTSAQCVVGAQNRLPLDNHLLPRASPRPTHTKTPRRRVCRAPCQALARLYKAQTALLSGPQTNELLFFVDLVLFFSTFFFFFLSLCFFLSSSFFFGLTQQHSIYLQKKAKNRQT